MAENLTVFNKSGEAVGEFVVDDCYLEFEKGSQAVHETVVAIMAAHRSGTGSSKTRAEVNGSKRKPYRQKGTGNARAGDRRSPIWRGGGVIFGPKSRSFEKKVNKKVVKLALRRSFSDRLKEGAVKLVEDLQLDDHKTKGAQAVMNALGLDSRTLIVVGEYEDNLLKATSNLADALLSKVSSLNVYQLLRFRNILFTKDALESFLVGVKKGAERAQVESI